MKISYSIKLYSFGIEKLLKKYRKQFLKMCANLASSVGGWQVMA